MAGALDVEAGTLQPVARSSSLHHLVRHDVSLQKGFGWEVAVRRGDCTYREHFADTVYGSKQKALKAAKQFRDALLEELRPHSPIKFKNALNTSGVVGVHRSLLRTRAGTEFEYYIASWPTPHGRPKVRKFSVAKYGEKATFQLAISARKQGIFEEFGISTINQKPQPPSEIFKRTAKRLKARSLSPNNG